jgi:hypothetical protein
LIILSHHKLNYIINKGYLNKFLIPISILFPSLSILLSAITLRIRSKTIAEILKKSKVEIISDYYEYKNIYVDSLKNYLKCVQNEIFEIYLHGSLGANEEKIFSDFDALVIIKDDAFKNRFRLYHLFYRLHKSRKIMFSMDPLQHHGWFVLYESQLKDYPATYFPPELFNYAKSLLDNEDLNITIKIPSDIEYNIPFIKLARSLINTTVLIKTNNVYKLKGFLSRVMLLPALYCQARDKRGIFKKYAFEEARKDFDKNIWAPVEIASEIRLKWHYKINPFQKFLLTRSNTYLRKVGVLLAPSVPNDLRALIPDNYDKQVSILLNKMASKLNVSL